MARRSICPDGGAFPVNVAAGEVTIGIRPEHVHINQSGDGQADSTITLVEYLGSEVFIYIALADQHRAGELLLSRCALACRFPAGLRLVIDSAGYLLAIKGLSSRTITGRLEWPPFRHRRRAKSAEGIHR